MAGPKLNVSYHSYNLTSLHMLTGHQRDKHHDAVQTFFDRTGGDDLHWTKALYGPLKVNDVPISIPMKQPVKSSLEGIARRCLGIPRKPRRLRIHSPTRSRIRGAW